LLSAWARTERACTAREAERAVTVVEVSADMFSGG